MTRASQASQGEPWTSARLGEQGRAGRAIEARAGRLAYLLTSEPRRASRLGAEAGHQMDLFVSEAVADAVTPSPQDPGPSAAQVECFE